MIRSHRKGFTLIELLLYVTISSAILLLCVFFFNGLLEARVKNQTIFEVDAQGTHIMLDIEQALRNADVVNSPSIGTNSNFLSINTIIPSNNPTVFTVSGGMLQIQEGTSPPISLTNSNVIISNLSFTNLSRLGTPGIIHIEFTVTASSSSSKHENTYTKNFVSSASLRQP